MAAEQAAADFGESADHDMAPDRRAASNRGAASDLAAAKDLDAATHLGVLARELLFKLPASSLEPFLAAWPPGPPPGPVDTSIATAALPVLDWLPMIADGIGGFGADLIACLCRTAMALQWRQTYSAAEAGAEFLRNYGHTEIIGPTAPWQSATIACGFLLLGPRTLYPRHSHEAEEIYVTLSGDAQWLQGDAVWRGHPPGALVHHGCDETHAMRTGERPLLALYLWRSNDLNQKARLHCNDELQ